MWSGTRAALRRAIRRVLRDLTNAVTNSIAWMLRVVREARFAALVAGAVLAMGVAGSAQAGIEVSDITAGIGGFAMDGEVAGDLSGYTVSNAGDVNGDGLTDAIVGARGTGRSYVVFGKPSGTLVQLSDVTAGGGGGFAIEGPGQKVSGVGDVNGDGLDDLIVGPKNAGFGTGRYVVFGKSDAIPIQISDVAAGVGGFAIFGGSSNLSGAGDVNGDGLADLLIGAYSAPGPRSGAGQSYVVFGKADGNPVELSDLTAGTSGFTIFGESFDDHSGRSLAGAGDVNGDGLADIIIGARGAGPHAGGGRGGDRSGRAYVVFGRESTASVRLSDIISGVGGFGLEVGFNGFVSSIKVSGAGDVNGDGFADMILSAGGISGTTFVVFGKSDGVLVQLSDVSAGDGGFPIEGSFSSVSGAGDLNGDGLADMMVGPYVVFGKTNGTLVQLTDIEDDIGGFKIEGIDSNVAGDYTGTTISGGGDVDGDGLADMVLGANATDANGPYSGRSYVVFSPEAAAASGTYIAKSRIGDGWGGNPVVPTRVGDSRCTIDFSDADFADNGSGGASTETVVLTRSNSGLTNLAPLGDVAFAAWQITSDRVGFTDAKVTLKYLDSEIAGISGPESSLAIFMAPAPSGPWTQLSSVVDATRNEISATVAGFGVFAIGDASSIIKPTPTPTPIPTATPTPTPTPTATPTPTPTPTPGPPMLELSDISAGNGGFAIDSPTNVGYFNPGISDAGDFNGDGLADFMIATPRANPNGSFSGRSYVIFGKPGRDARSAHGRYNGCWRFCDRWRGGQ